MDRWGKPFTTRSTQRRRGPGLSPRPRVVAVVTSLFTPLATAPADAAPVGQGFNLNPSDLRFILKQIKIAEAPRRHLRHADEPLRHAARDRPEPDPQRRRRARSSPGACEPSTAPATTCSPGRTKFGAADQPSRGWAGTNLATPSRRPPTARTRARDDTSYTQKNGTVLDSQPRLISNLIVDQTATNPAAVAAAARRRCDAVGHPLHPEHGARRRPVRALQLVVHPLRPVLRPRPRPDQQGRRHGLRAA